ncbi:MAG: M14 family zinc carboxypeptidase [bacterium]
MEPKSLAELFDEIISCTAPEPARGIELGRSRENRAVTGYRFGRGHLKVSLIAGCHADEPVGPLLLSRLVGYLSGVRRRSAILGEIQWWIVPHINPDGAARNRLWCQDAVDHYDLETYLRHAVRELPGDDVEFGFPRSGADRGARPENRAVYDWWKTDAAPFSVHVSLHGMAVGGGPWFLIDPAWADRCGVIKQRCRDVSHRLGYTLHDVQRHGEKGFTRIERGFCTRPDSRAMAKYFLERNDPDTAGRFRPSSMETIRSHGGDPLTLVSEIPLFAAPGIGDQIEPSDPAAELWRDRISNWKKQIDHGGSADKAAREIAASTLIPVPVLDQMRLQWAFVSAGIEQVVIPGHWHSA